MVFTRWLRHRANMGGVMDVALVVWRNSTGILVTVAVFLIFLAGFWKVFRPIAAAGNRSELERRFRNVFSMMTEDRRQALIDHYSYKNDCGREEAMKRAIDDRNRDDGRW